MVMTVQMVVMNGSKLLQELQDGQVYITQVVPKGGLRNGIYPLNLADKADTRTSYSGTVLHVDHHSLYQEVDGKIIRHERQNFHRLPAYGNNVMIRYTAGWAVVSQR